MSDGRAKARARRWPGESLRLAFLLLATAGVTLPLFTGRLVGGVDASWYCRMLRDFIDQERAGRFPVFLGQGIFAWNGAAHPFRSAPVFMHVAALWDLLTLRTLSAPWLQHLAAITATAAGGLGVYLGGVRLAPHRRWEVALIAFLYLASPAWLSVVYWQDAYMTAMALGALPLVAFGNVRTLEDEDGGGYGALAAGLAVTWMSHPPVAMLATLATLAIQTGSFLCGGPVRARARAALAGSALFAGMAAYYFVSMRELPKPPGSVNPLPYVGLGLAVAGIANGALKQRRAWLAAFAAGEALLWPSDRPWFWWMAATAVLAAAAAGLLRRARRAEPSERICEILLPASLVAACLTQAWLGPAYPGWDADALMNLRGNAACGQGLALPIPSERLHGDDLGLGPGLWIAVGLAGALFFRRAPSRAKVLFPVLVFAGLGLVRIPFVSDFLAGSFPGDLREVCNFPFALRLAPAATAFAAMGGALWLGSRASARGPADRGVLILLGAAAAWSGVEAWGFDERGWSASQSEETTARDFRPENVTLTRYAYDMLPIPSTFSNGETDPMLAVRLLDSAGRVVLGPEAIARRMEEAGTTRIELTARQDPTAAAWLNVSPGLTLAPGEHVLARFEFEPGRNYAGYLILRSEHGYREYHLPASGSERSFGVGGEHSNVISLWNSGAQAEHYAISMVTEPGNDLDRHGGRFARVNLSRYDPDRNPIRLDTLDPYRITTQTRSGGWVETGRVFVGGYSATVDGKPAQVAASRDFLATVAVPPGVHHVKLRYVGTPTLWLAGAISAACWAGAGLGLVTARARRSALASRMPKSELVTRVVRFALVGGAVFLFFTSMNWALGLRLGKQAAFLIAYPPALGLHFFLNKKWTFGCVRTDVHRQAGEYALMAAGTFLVQWAVFSALAAATPLPGWMDAGLSNAAQMAITFVVMQRRIFAPAPAS